MTSLRKKLEQFRLVVIAAVAQINNVAAASLSHSKNLLIEDRAKANSTTIEAIF